ncbi:MAG TPA: transposase [Gaiellaceae bacterium]|nr:transposase [Gaiellaceae bacterium]
MGRELRIIDCDCWYHVTCRGCNRGTIAWDRHDFASLEGELDRAAVRYGWELAAWCFMPNHYHLILRTPRGGFSEGLQVMNGTHSRRTNRDTVERTIFFAIGRSRDESCLTRIWSPRCCTSSETRSRPVSVARPVSGRTAAIARWSERLSHRHG